MRISDPDHILERHMTWGMASVKAVAMTVIIGLVSMRHRMDIHLNLGMGVEGETDRAPPLRKTSGQIGLGQAEHVERVQGHALQ